MLLLYPNKRAILSHHVIATERRGDSLPSDKDKSSTDRTLKEFSKCCMALCEVLHSDKALDEMELLFIDNHLQVLQMAYQQWKRKARKRQV